METQPQHTIWLWLEGFFPRRVSYYLLLKGLVSSPADLLAGKTTDPNLRISLMKMDVSIGWVFLDQDDPSPPGASTPCLRITDPATGTSRYLYESASILAYFETIHADRSPSLMPRDPVLLGGVNDMIGAANLACGDSAYYIRHAVAQAAAWSGLKDEERSHAAALNAYAGMVRNLAKLQRWGAEGLETTGWLTPGVRGPGLVDVTVASGRRYLELAYGLDMFEREELGGLAGWYERFRRLSWWDALEEREDVHPPALRLGKECREV